MSQHRLLAATRRRPPWHEGDTAPRVHVAVTDDALLWAARRISHSIADRAHRRTDLARPGSTPWRLVRAGGEQVTVGPLFSRLLAVALDAARATDGLFDPTVGGAVIGYAARLRALDVVACTAALPVCSGAVPAVARRAVGFESVRVGGLTVQVPAGTVLDLSAATDAVVAATAARAIADRLHIGALVAVGGDVAQAGPAPAGGWDLPLPDGAACRLPDGRAAATVRPGVLNPVIDPRSGAAADCGPSCVTVLHADLVVAKSVAVAAAVLGDGATGFLTRRDVDFRLLGADSVVTASAGWPSDVRTRAAPPPLHRHPAAS